MLCPSLEKTEGGLETTDPSVVEVVIPPQTSIPFLEMMPSSVECGCFAVISAGDTVVLLSVEVENAAALPVIKLKVP